MASFVRRNRVIRYVKPECVEAKKEATSNEKLRQADLPTADVSAGRRDEAKRLSALSHAALMREALAAMDFSVDLSPAKLRSKAADEDAEDEDDSALTLLVDYSPLDILTGRVDKKATASEEPDSMEQLRTEVLRRFGPCNPLKEAQNTKIERMQCDRACGALVGLAIADALGHWVEFVDCCNGKSNEHFYDPMSGCVTNPLNTFELEPGQWTDDFSMALCLADSLLYAAACPQNNSHIKAIPLTKRLKPANEIPSGAYDGSDLRARFSAWWNHGYCNAFRYDTDREPCDSCGLGGNISKSLAAIKDYKSVSEIPPVYEVPGGSEDAGNGSIMRLAPVAVRFFGLRSVPDGHDSELGTKYQLCLDVAGASSLATHPGPKARDSARFLAYVISRAIERDDTDICDIQQFLIETRDGFIKAFGGDCDKEVVAMLECKSSHPGEVNWNWTNPKGELKVLEALKERGSAYNGYTVNPGYFGSFCIDGLALALHCCYWSMSFEDAIVTCINFLGDADSTGAVCGQIAGAFYGYQGIPPKYVSIKDQWDWGDTELRAALLAGCRLAGL